MCNSWQRVHSSMFLEIRVPFFSLYRVKLINNRKIWIAVVSDQLEVLLDSYVKPSCKISSWMSNLHGIEEKHVDSAPSIEQVLSDLRKILSSDCILVGQSIASDVAYLNLKQVSG